MIHISANKTCEVCPAQWEGQTLEGQSVYIRYRWGTLRLDLDGETVYQIEYGHPHNGAMTVSELNSLLNPQGYTVTQTNEEWKGPYVDLEHFVTEFGNLLSPYVMGADDDPSTSGND